MNEYIHYGSDHYDPQQLQESIDTLIKNEYKPLYSSCNGKPVGLWGSPIDSEYSWYDWCMGNGVHKESLEKSFTFTLSDKANILEVHSEDNILKYLDPNYRNVIPNHHPWISGLTLKTAVTDRFDLKKLMGGYDGLELFLSENWWLREGMFYLWDVDSIVVWNPDIIKEVNKDVVDDSRCSSCDIPNRIYPLSEDRIA